MSEYTFHFVVNQAAEGVVFTSSNSETPVAPGNRAGWSSQSFKRCDSDVAADLEPDGGHWVGTVNMLPDDIYNITASYFPTQGAIDNVQLSGPIMMRQAESAIAIVGGGGKFAGARGEARCTAALSDQGAPLYRYDLTFDV